MKTFHAALISLLLCAPVLANDSPEALLDAFLAGMLANDAAAMAACYTDDAVTFAVSSMVEIGPAAIEASWEGFFSEYSVLDIELFDKHMETHGDTAYAWGLFKLTASPVAGGEPVVMSGRFMDVSRNVDGSWLYVADHVSMPLPGDQE